MFCPDGFVLAAVAEIVAVLDSTRLLGRVITSDLKYDPTQQILSKKRMQLKM